jgi:hypothetical protein
MAAKQKAKKHKKSKRPAGKNLTRVRTAVRKKRLKKKGSPNNKLAKNKPARKSAGTPKKRLRGRSQNLGTVEFTPAGMGARSGGQSGSLQGLSDIGVADSESVDELIEEGNAFEAEVVKGVEDAPDADQEEVHTHELPEDDVPEEYDGQ